MTDDLEYEYEDTEEMDLLYSQSIAARIFVLNSPPTATILGINLEENEDSFLVAIPAKLVEIQGVTKVASFLEVPYFRLMKSSVVSVIPLYGIFEEKYIEYLKEHGSDVYPELEDFIMELHLTYPEEESEDTAEYSGMCHEELESYLNEKLTTGNITNGNSRLKH